MNDPSKRHGDNSAQSFAGKSGVAPSDERLATSADDPRLVRAAQAYLKELEAGKHPDRHQWLARYPELAEDLNQCIEGLEMVFQASPASASPDAPASIRDDLGSEYPAIPLGDFQIVREIGRGGMGIVYEAVQLSLGRRVALKVLPLAATLDSRYLQRFQHEAQAAAQLHHNNIVPVYAVGCERGIHFYAMQLIEGQSLDVVIRQLRRHAGLGTSDAVSSATASYPATSGDASSVDVTAAWTSQAAPWSQASAVSRSAETIADTRRHGSEPFSTQDSGKNVAFYRAAARCMAQAAEAMEYAHQQGIIHRDIKPANLLIDIGGEVWITDFGLAQLPANSGLTQTGDLVGTVRYMSPEQASGQRVVLDHRTDVYSLGATFYELLTLEPVFAGTTRHNLLFQVLNRDPRPLRAIDRKIPPELETIILKSLGKNPADRYASAQDLADDLHRFLRDEPIRAKRPSPVERVRKWARRHPSLIGAGVVVMFVTLVISLSSNWLITQANNRTKTALAQEQLRAEEAERQFRQARRAVDLLVEVSQQELLNKPPMQGLRRRLLEAAISYYQDFISQRRDNPSTQAELIAEENRLKKILDDLSVLEGAGQMILLSNENVQEDLALTEAQRKQVDAIVQQFSQMRQDSLQNFDRLTSEQRKAKFLALARTNDHLMHKTLTASQLSRLSEIMVQLQGPMAFEQPEIVERLRMTETQCERVRQIGAETFREMCDFTKADRVTSLTDLHAQIMQKAMDRVLAILTAEQLVRWKQIIGKPFAHALDMTLHGPPMGPM
jgi:serine/threonine protein kinase